MCSSGRTLSADSYDAMNYNFVRYQASSTDGGKPGTRKPKVNVRDTQAGKRYLREHAETETDKLFDYVRLSVATPDALRDTSPSHDDACKPITGCVDKLDLKVSSTGIASSLIPEFVGTPDPHAHSRKLYAWEVDCRKLGIQARLHFRSLFVKDRHHKIELLQVGKLTLRAGSRRRAKLTEASFDDLAIMRIDLASNV